MCKSRSGEEKRRICPTMQSIVLPEDTDIQEHEPFPPSHSVSSIVYHSVSLFCVYNYLLYFI